jgi:hypothetical protein
MNKTKELIKCTNHILALAEEVYQSTINLKGYKSDLPINREIDRHTAGKIINDLNLKTPEGKKHNFTTLRDAVLNS